MYFWVYRLGLGLMNTMNPKSQHELVLLLLAGYSRASNCCKELQVAVYQDPGGMYQDLGTVPGRSRAADAALRCE